MTMAKSREYWQKRSEQVAQLQFDKADEYVAKLQREYERASESIRQSVEVFYQRYAINNEISLAETRRLLTGKELTEFKMSLEEFTAKAKDNADGRWTQLLNSIYFKTRISRLEALEIQIRQQVELLTGNRQKATRALLADAYEDTYYRNIYELQKGTGIGVSFARLNDDGIETALSTEYVASNWSKRIWGDRDKLTRELQTKLTQSFIRGDSVERTVRDIRERMGVSKSNAERLVQSETGFFVGQATMAGYKASGIVQKYEILATLDNRTSDICRSMDGHIFNLSEMNVGVNYPPFHSRCRTTTVAAFDDEVDPGERIARDNVGRTYFVQGDIVYPDWKKQYVDAA
jgi:SPP1 gp7 family putative phage head morphogenesis protein